jgi:hypothetical protein
MASAQPGDSAIGANVREQYGGNRDSEQMTINEPTQLKTRLHDRVWLPALLSALAEYPSLTRACAAAGVTREHVSHLRAKDPEFYALTEAAKHAGMELLEDIAVDRVVEGISRPIYNKGQVVGEYRDYSERLHIELLRANNAKYRQASQGGNGGNVSYNLAIHFSPAPAHLAPSAGQPTPHDDVIDGDVVAQDGDSVE